MLETVLDKDRNRRYRTALDLADDIDRVRRHEPIVAKPAGPWTKVVRWAQRNPTVAVMSAVIVLALGTAVGIFAWKNREVTLANSLLTSKNVELRAERDRVIRLKDRRVLRRLRERAEDHLYPAHPDLVGGLGEWLDEAGELLKRLPLHRQSLAALEAAAGPYSDAQKARDHPDAWLRLVTARARLAELDDAIDETDSEVEERSLEAESERCSAPRHSGHTGAAPGRTGRVRRRLSTGQHSGSG